jgi:hypothetical protein
MTIDAEQMDDYIEQLLTFLDGSIICVEQMLEMLSGLRAALIRRDASALQRMQDALPQIAADKQNIEQKLASVCMVFARGMDCPAEQVNLTRIAAVLPLLARMRLLEKQKSLQSLVGRLSVEHRSTETLLHECERLNRLLLTSIVGKRDQTLTYAPDGRSRRELHRSIISMRM